MATASALSADGADCSTGQAALGVSTTGAAQGCWTVQQPASTTALKVGTVGGAFADYAGATCTNQFPRVLSASGAPTCASVGDADFSGTLTQGKGGTGAGSLTCSAGQHLTSNGTIYSCSADTAVVHAMASATHSDVDTAATSANDILIRDGTNTTWQHRALVVTDLPAHLLMGTQHSDVDTAAITGGDLVVRNSGNTQWTHQATGTAGQVLHGGTNVVTWGAVADADLTGAVGIAHGGTANGSLGVTAGGVLYMDGAKAMNSGAGSAGQVLQSNAGSAPTWVSIPVNYELAADYSNATTSMTSVTGIAWAIAISETKSFNCWLVTDASATTLAPNIQFTGPASPTMVAFLANLVVSATANTYTFQNVAAFSSATTGAASPGTTKQTWTVEGVVVNGGTGGTVQLQAKASGTGTVNIRKGSTCWVH